MDRLIAVNSAPIAQAATAPASGTPQYAAPGTVWPSYQYNALQEELIAILVAAGVTPDRNNNGQLIAALQSMFGNGGILASTGYQRLSGGLIMQWGNAVSVAGGAHRLITFPTAFLNACFFITATVGATTDSTTPSAAGGQILSATQANVYNLSGGTVALNWLVLGS